MDESATQRDNPLTQHLNKIAALNAQYGSRAEGGSGAPVVSEQPPAAKGGVSLPPPTELTPEEEAELQKAWDEEQRARMAVSAPPTRSPLVLTESPVAIEKITPARTAPLTDFTFFDLTRAVVIADNGETFEIPEKFVKELKAFAFKLSIETLNARMLALAASLGIQLTPPQPEAVPVDGDKNV